MWSRMAASEEEAPDVGSGAAMLVVLFCPRAVGGGDVGGVRATRPDARLAMEHDFRSPPPLGQAVRIDRLWNCRHPRTTPQHSILEAGTPRSPSPPWHPASRRLTKALRFSVPCRDASMRCLGPSLADFTHRIFSQRGTRASSSSALCCISRRFIPEPCCPCPRTPWRGVFLPSCSLPLWDGTSIRGTVCRW